MTAKTIFSVFDNRMPFDRADSEMISMRIHRFYPRTLKQTISRLRGAFVELYQRSGNEMFYSASYQNVEGQRFEVKEMFFTNHKSHDISGECNFLISIESPELKYRNKFDTLLSGGERIVTSEASTRCCPDFKKELVEFERYLTSEHNGGGRVFSEVRVSDLCILIGDIFGRFNNELFVLDYTISKKEQYISVVFCGRDTKSHTVTISGTYQK